MKSMDNALATLLLGNSVARERDQSVEKFFLRWIILLSPWRVMPR